MRDVVEAVSILGIPRKTERASDMHRAMRKQLHAVCDEAEQHLQMIQEREGLGLDCVLFDFGEHLAVRWVRYHEAGVLNRNDTERQAEFEGQGILFTELVPDEQRLHATLGLQLADDYVEAGHPCWWLKRLVLIRETPDHTTQFLEEIKRYAKPTTIIRTPQTEPILISGKEPDRKIIRRLVRKAMSA